MEGAESCCEFVYRVAHLIADQSWVDFDLCVPLPCPIGKWYHFFRVAIKIGFPGSGLFLITTSTPLASIPDRIRNSPKVSANAKNQLHEKEEIWILANYHLRISSGQ